jgi:hypothetical protein
MPVDAVFPQYCGRQLWRLLGFELPITPYCAFPREILHVFEDDEHQQGGQKGKKPSRIVLAQKGIELTDAGRKMTSWPDIKKHRHLRGLGVSPGQGQANAGRYLPRF